MRQHNRTREDECVVNAIIPLCSSELGLAAILSKHLPSLSFSTILSAELYATASISCLYATYLCCKNIGEQNDQVREEVERNLGQPIRNLQQLIRQREELERAMQESIANQSQGRTQLTREELQKKIIEILKQLSESQENADSKLNSIMLATIPIIKNPEIFENPEFLQLLKKNFPEIINPESFKKTLKELYLSFVNLEEEEQRFGLILRLKELIPQTPPPQHTMSDSSSSSSDSEPEIDFRRRFVNFCQGISELLNRDRDSSDSESDRSSSSDGFRGVASASYEPLLEQPQQQAMR